MGAKDGKSSGSGRPAPAKPARRRLASDALREEAERRWAQSDRDAARGERRTQARAKRRGEARERDAELKRLKRKLPRGEQGGGGKAN